jgi:UDP-2,3-diacylglucosamine pyrophosphatase LpxH
MWISDIHLGTRHCDADALLAFLAANGGDWVENCTALVEHLDGHLDVVCSTTPPEAASMATCWAVPQ